MLYLELSATRELYEDLPATNSFLVIFVRMVPVVVVAVDRAIGGNIFKYSIDRARR